MRIHTFNPGNPIKRGGVEMKGRAQWMVPVIVVVVILLFSSVRIIDQTEVGVVRILGKVSDAELGPGLNIVFPFITSVIKIPVYEQTVEMAGPDSIKALTSEGLEVTYDLAVQFNIDPAKASSIYSQLKNYHVWMSSRIRSAGRDIIAEYKAEDLYTTKRNEVQMELSRKLSEQFEPYGINMKAILIRNIDLPDSVVQKIEAKISAKQEAEKMEFVIQKESLEADRKVIEAQGIADANKIIANSLNDRYLTWYWIQNLDKHNDVIYVPVGENGMPMFKSIT
ncbi:prohibitin family protein [Candidatus Woesearchaeota archaeon]|nr:prohibitin family protein [Candidatus Woesearchaeota archaeon]